MTSPYKVQICTLSDQVDQNLFPIFDENYRPEKVVILVTQKMKDKKSDEIFTNAICPELVNEVIPVKVESLDNIEELQQVYQKVLSQYVEDPSKVLVNITGGNKLIAIIGSRFCEGSVDYVYVSNVNNKSIKLVFFLPEKGNAESKESSVVEYRQLHVENLPLKLYLKAHGITIVQKDITWKPLSKEERAFSDFILGSSRKVKNAMSVLNGVITFFDTPKNRNTKDPRPKRSFLEYPVKDKREVIKGFDPLIDKLQEYDYADYRNGSLFFKNEDKLKFVHGRWLEQYTAETISSLGLDISPASFEFLHHNDSVKNEFDVVFFYEQRLHIIEVKTSALSSEQNVNQIQNIVHKLKNLKDIAGGLSCKAAVVSLFKANENFGNRLNEGDITFIGGEDLRTLDSFKTSLLSWIKS